MQLRATKAQEEVAELEKKAQQLEVEVDKAGSVANWIFFHSKTL